MACRQSWSEMTLLMHSLCQMCIAHGARPKPGEQLQVSKLQGQSCGAWGRPKLGHSYRLASKTWERPKVGHSYRLASESWGKAKAGAQLHFQPD